MAGSVIQATGAVEFGDGLRMEVLLGGCWCHFWDFIKTRISFFGTDWSWAGLLVIWTPVRPNSKLGTAHQWYQITGVK